MKQFFSNLGDKVAPVWAKVRSVLSKVAVGVGKFIRRLLPKWVLGNEKIVATAVGVALTWASLKFNLALSPEAIVSIGGVVTGVLVWTSENTGQATP